MSWPPSVTYPLPTDDVLIAVELNNGDVVSVQVKWLIGLGEWTVAYRPNGETIGREDIDSKFFARSVRRSDIRRILG